MLFPPGDANYRQAQNSSHHYVHNSGIQTAAQDPDEIKEYVQTTHGVTVGDNLFTKWPQYEPC